MGTVPLRTHVLVIRQLYGREAKGTCEETLSLYLYLSLSPSLSLPLSLPLSLSHSISAHFSSLGSGCQTESR